MQLGTVCWIYHGLALGLSIRTGEFCFHYLNGHRISEVDIGIKLALI